MADLGFDPRRFRSNVPYYAKFRLSYPDSLIARVAAIVRLKVGDRVMDLGCGPGLLAIPFAKAGMSVTAVDPEPGMLARLGDAARAADVSIDARLGSSFDMPDDIGRFKLVTMGRSFHWMDRAATLDMLDACVVENGALALFHDEHHKTAENNWWRALHAIANDYGRNDSPAARWWESDDYRRHESYLLESSFSELESIGVFVRREITADDIVGLAFSLSSCSPDNLGDRVGSFESELRQALANLSSNGRFTELAEVVALLARRP